MKAIKTTISEIESTEEKNNKINVLLTVPYIKM